MTAPGELEGATPTPRTLEPCPSQVRGAHTVEIMRGSQDTWVQCSCGFAGPRRSSDEDAAEAWSAHRRPTPAVSTIEPVAWGIFDAADNQLCNPFRSEDMAKDYNEGMLKSAMFVRPLFLAPPPAQPVTGGTEGDGIPVDWDMESKDVLGVIDSIYKDYSSTFGMTPNDFMAKQMLRVHARLFDWWTTNHDAIRAAIASPPAQPVTGAGTHGT